MSNANNPYGDGKASEKILNSVLKAYNSDKFDIKGSDQIKNHIGKELLRIQDEITVFEYEEMNPGTTINMVFKDSEIKFPHPDLNLKDKNIIVNKFRME